MTFSADGPPSQAEKTQTAVQVASLLQQAKAIGQRHASDEMAESGAWGGDFADALMSAREIVDHFVEQIEAWLNDQDPDTITDGDIEAYVQSKGEIVGDTEIAAAIEQAVLDALDTMGATLVRSETQEGACETCEDYASETSSIDAFDPPPYHPRCRCSTVWADED